jgi:hypothetical protein
LYALTRCIAPARRLRRQKPPALTQFADAKRLKAAPGNADTAFRLREKSGIAGLRFTAR